jgi:hypothetical protein
MKGLRLLRLVDVDTVLSDLHIDSRFGHYVRAFEEAYLQKGLEFGGLREGSRASVLLCSANGHDISRREAIQETGCCCVSERLRSLWIDRPPRSTISTVRTHEQSLPQFAHPDALRSGTSTYMVLARHCDCQAHVQLIGKCRRELHHAGRGKLAVLA